MSHGLIKRIFIAVVLTFSLHCSADPRRFYSTDSPGWLRTVGKLTVPGYKYQNGDRLHHVQHCTATLLSSTIILSGWHCLEHYNDLSMDIVFTLAHRRRIAIRLTDGGGMQADWALLKLNKPINTRHVKTLPVATRSLASSRAKPLTMAGYSHDSDLAASSQNLSYHTDCEILGDEIYRVATNCVAYKGASGGPVVYREKIIGVVSVGDSMRLSYFTPSVLFIEAINDYLLTRQ